MKKFLRILKRLALVFLILCILAIIALAALSRGPWDQKILESERQWGITFSTIYTRQLELPVEETHLALLDELAVKRIRLPVYWPEVEEREGVFDFSLYDWFLDRAEERGVSVILTIGRRVPRWPECHVPEWARELSEQEQQQRILSLLEAEIRHFQERRSIWAWQVENEPFILFFGECPKADKEFFSREVAFVRGLDPARPIIVSDSGELSLWYEAARYSDIFATTMYRVVPTLDQKDFTTWHIPAWFYTKKANLVHRITPLKDVMVIELQAEPWAQLRQVQLLPFIEQFRSFDTARFHDNIRYVRETNFKEVYLWGAEWWYWAKKHNHPEFWNIAKLLFNGKI